MKSDFLKLAGQTLVLTALVLLAVIPFSGRLTEEGIRITGGDYLAPSIETLEGLDSSTVKMDFSEPVKITSVVVSKVIRDLSDSSEHSVTEVPSPAIAAAGGAYGRIPVEAQVSESGLCVTYLFEKECEVGQAYEIYGVVEDKTGNSLTFCVPFTGYNSKVPQLLITELQIKYSKGKAEFVELLILKDGNLGGLELLSGADGEKKKFELPPVEVKKGEVLLLHPRKVEDDCVNENGDDLSQATAPYSCQGVRDLWAETSESHFNDSADVVLIRNGSTGQILDAVMYALDTVTEWKSGPAAFAKAGHEAGIFSEEEIGAAFDCKGVTYTKSIQRADAAQIRERLMNGEEINLPVDFAAEDWVVTAAKPGTL